MPAVLLVEDDDLMRQSYGTFLKQSGEFQLVAALASLKASVDRLGDDAAERPDLIITDLSLPDATPTDVVRTLKEAAPGVPVLVVSGHRSAEYVDAAFEAGAQGYVLKGTAREILDGAHTVLSGETFLSERLSGL